MNTITVSEIAQGVFQYQLQAMRANLDGCIVGQDPIHLHDMRVANRRVRAALIEFKTLFPNDSINRYQDEFQWIHQVTTKVRDLDVNMQHYAGYKRQIPKKWRPFLEPLRELIYNKRESAQEVLIKDLCSERMTDLLKDWNNDLIEEMLKSSALSLEPAKEYGCRRIIKRYQQVRKKGGKLTKKTPAEEYHNYRITVKKLRYLMEFFHQLLYDEGYKVLRRGLKNVQDAFGAFQDAEIQAYQLQIFADELYQAGASTNTLLSLGQLLFSLEKKGRQSKKACLKQVNWILDDATARAFQTCFQYPVE